MTKFVKGALLAGVVSLALVSLASAQAVSDLEFKCQAGVNKAGAKFVGAKSKCISKCLVNAGKLLNPYTDCFPPYGGTTATCINDVVLLKGAENKFQAAIIKACTLDCPECYNGGDCSASGFAGDQVANIEGQVDSFVPGVACEQPGADAAETKCELNTAKVLSKQVGSLNKCVDKCKSNERKALIAAGSCDPITDPATLTCVSLADGKTIAAVNKLCGDVGAIPDCSGTDDYPSGAAWTGLVDFAILGNVPTTYCASPSGAFIQ